jgi:hypothetical protein
MWYYLDSAQQQQGPFDATQFDGLIAAGTIAPGTLVWQEGQASWLPLSQVRPALAAAETCQACNRPVGADNLIELGGVRVCAACKPVALQKLREGVGVGAEGVWAKDSKVVVTHDGATFPPRCVKCNADSPGGPIKRNVYWHHPALYILLVAGILFRIGILLYIIVAAIVRRKAIVHLHLCPRHRFLRTAAIVARWAAVPLAFIWVLLTGSLIPRWIMPVGLVLFFCLLIIGIFMSRTLRASMIEKDKTVFLKGLGRPFIASLPPWKGP